MEVSKFAQGDWIVHNAYGVGQIRKIEEKPIHGEMVSVFRVKTRNSIYWLPIENVDNSRVRAISDEAKIHDALQQIEDTPHEIGSDYRARNHHISEVLQHGTLLLKVELLRDLLALRQEKVWSNTENDAANTLFDQLTSEYSVVQNVPIEAAREEINQRIIACFEGCSML